MEAFLNNLIAGLVGAFLVFIVQWIFRVMVENRAPFSGTWYEQIYDDEGNVVKKDTHYIRQRGDTLTGKIQRTYPPEQTHRRYLFNGRIRGRNYFAIFWSTSPDILSYGCWYMRQIDDDSFDGYYLSLKIAEKGKTITKFTELVKPVRLSLRRDRFDRLKETQPAQNVNDEVRQSDLKK